MNGPPVGRRALLASGAVALTACIPRCEREHAEDSHLVRDPQGILDLPKGFTYSVVQRTGEKMSDGHRVPGLPDAMGCFPGKDGQLIVMRNHELLATHGDLSPWYEHQKPAPEAYDAKAPGGVTRLVIDAGTGRLVSSNLVLAGTLWNCAGGLSPWGWLSCEETTEPNHGYVFLCATDAESVRPYERIDGYGRFRHEAAAVDPRTSIAYLTEDQSDACFYRFVPREVSKPFEGKLQALRVRDRPGYDTSQQTRVQALAVDWVDIDEPTPEQDTVRQQAQAKGAATFSRTEGLWVAGDDAFMCATTGGPIGSGQVFRFDVRANTLELIARSEDRSQLDMPDNITVSPDGHLYVAEDGIDYDNRLRVITLDGTLRTLAHARVKAEFAGPCFAPDGRTLFVNVQQAGLTLAIRGPFDRVLDQLPALHASAERSAPLQAGTLGLAALATTALLWRRNRVRNDEPS